MAYKKGEHPGTTWRKCDFQCHSPRDLGWQGSLSLPGGTPEYEEARKDWANKLVEAAVAAGLGAIAVTDHHDVCMPQYVIEAASQANNNLFVLAGMEITCSDNAQCLAVFDPSTTIDQQKAILAKAGGVVPSNHNDSKTCTIIPVTKTVSEIFREVANDPSLRDACVLLPHFSSDDAHKSLNQKGHHPRFAALDCDAVYIERPISDLDEATLSKVQGKIEEWGTRRRAILATGDNRSASWDRLGKHDCWIKLGENSIEALRQAFLADEARIAFTKPMVPSERLISITVKSTLTGSEAVRFTLNEGFTALIGGRGSGKSALLEYLRFGLGRGEGDIEDEVESPREREADLLNDTLQDGYVELELEREGVQEKWRRTLVGRDSIEVTDRNNVVTDITLKVARERFRARAFRQKGLSTTMSDLRTAADQITGIAAAEELVTQRRIEYDLNNAKRELTTALQQVAAFWQARLEATQTTAKASDLRLRLASLSERLSAEGVSQEHLEIINQAPTYQRAHTYLKQVGELVKSDIAKLSPLASQILKTDFQQLETILSFDEVAAMQATISEAQKNISAQLESAVNQLEAVEQKRQELLSSFSTKDQTFKESLTAALALQTAHKAAIDDNTRLANELQVSEALASSAAATLRDRSSAVATLEQASKNLFNLLDERREVLKQAAAKVAGRSSNLLKARLKQDASPAEYISSLRALCEGSAVRDADQRIADWVQTALKADPNAWSGICSELVTIYEMKISLGAPPDPGEDVAAKIKALFFGGGQLTDNQSKKIFQNLSDATVGAVLASAPKDAIILTYVDEGRDIPFAKASPGQQASALLELLLKQSAGTLIIDQPEDDLDNRVIMKIVDLIRSSKSDRQLIFTTHNPNVVVNGDADKIIALRSAEPQTAGGSVQPRIQIDTDGAIETPTVREAITTVMEGGEAAFDLRRRKYRFGVLYK
ncbi:TrlF family AAA-like ATPase [Hyphomicrobium sp. B1]|uniref:TrlF family AAA-like ATPase n=1 Tax=Hyphomicrobium sp. B1 TaxID=3075651 RepID=UPI003C3036D7